MSVISQLATSLDIRNEEPNKVLAKKIVGKNDKAAVNELVKHLSSKDKNIQSDCIKVLYEIGEAKPELIADHDKIFLDLLDNKNNRLVWGAMTALDGIASVNPTGIHKNLAKILIIADKGSVITKDHGINILIKLGAIKKYEDNMLTLLLDQFKDCPTNQLPKYAEDSFSIVTEKFKPKFIKTLQSRLSEIEKDTKKKRVEKIIKKLQS
ncbi:MAG TPA: hypothetical protein VNZ49_10190 [Bacteroidia bacterium]|jgi:hypothetical protein|nr:hypothetical protein [Bacteroidia bacterium]